MHKDSEKTWLAQIAEDRRYAAMAGLGFFLGASFSARLFDAIGVAVGSGRTNRDDRCPQ